MTYICNCFVLETSNGDVAGHVDTKATEDARQSLIILGGIFVVSLLGLSYVYMMFPELDE